MRNSFLKRKQERVHYRSASKLLSDHHEFCMRRQEQHLTKLRAELKSQDEIHVRPRVWYTHRDVLCRKIALLVSRFVRRRRLKQDVAAELMVALPWQTQSLEQKIKE